MATSPHALLAHLIDGVVDGTARRLGGGPATPDRVREALVEAVDEVLGPVAPRLERLARLAEVGVRAATVGHELRNPLSVIETSLFLLTEKNADPRTARLLRRISEQVSTSTAIISELLDGAQNRTEQRVPVDLAEVCEYALDAVPRASNVSVERDLPRSVARVSADPRRLRQVAVNLLQNAVRALADRPGGTVSVRVGADAPCAWLSVTDDGPGIAFPERLFELLHTTHAEGLGIGLALSRRIAVEHGGGLTGGNRAGGGAWFRVELPLLGDRQP